MHWRLISLVVVFVLVAAIGSCSRGQSPAGRSLLAAHKASTGGAGPSVELTAEELAILKLPLEERRRVLESKLREKLVELYGRIPDRSASGKQVSDASSSGHRVERTEGGHVINELLNLAETAAGAVWSVSFAERLEGDLNFDGEVKIDDITPLAVHFGHVYPDDPEHPDVPPDYPGEMYIDFEIDRVSSNDFDATGLGKIGIEDITPIAQNFNLVLESYNVYLEDESTSELTLLDALPVSRLPSVTRTTG